MRDNLLNLETKSISFCALFYLLFYDISKFSNKKVDEENPIPEKNLNKITYESFFNILTKDTIIYSLLTFLILFDFKSFQLESLAQTIIGILIGIATVIPYTLFLIKINQKINIEKIKIIKKILITFILNFYKN